MTARGRSSTRGVPRRAALARLVWLATLCVASSMPELARARVISYVPADSRQLLVVTTRDWSDLHGMAQRLERRGGLFRAVGAPFAVVIGHHGLGWGRGLPWPEPRPGPIKREGDGRSPAGLFVLGTAFGYAPQTDTALAYQSLSADIECVDDASSAHYNELVVGREVSRDWNSSEHMRRNDDLYRLGVVVNHNTPASPGAGSCIFLHIWRGADDGTVGCTAMDPDHIRLLLHWLDPAQRPLLLQLPRPEYERSRRRWQLPPLPP